MFLNSTVNQPKGLHSQAPLASLLPLQTLPTPKFNQWVHMEWWPGGCIQHIHKKLESFYSGVPPAYTDKYEWDLSPQWDRKTLVPPLMISLLITAEVGVEGRKRHEGKERISINKKHLSSDDMGLHKVPQQVASSSLQTLYALAMYTHDSVARATFLSGHSHWVCTFWLIWCSLTHGKF